MPGLYGDLPSAKKEAAASDTPATWGSTPKLQPQPRKPAPLAPPPSLLRSGGRGGGRTPGGRGRGPGLTTTTSADGTTIITSETSATPSLTAPSIFASVQDEYDPMRPNDYEEILRDRARAKREAEAEAERLAKVKEMEAAMEKLRQQEEGPSSSTDSARSSALNVSGEDAYLRRGRMGAGPVAGPSAGPMDAEGAGAAGLGAAGGTPGPTAGGDTGGGDKSDKGMTLAQKMLMKMGWRAGEGLGRERQGISTPLVMQKTNARAGVIVNAEPAPGSILGEKRARSGAMIIGAPSRVLCLRNMVGPGEVDEELEEEVGLECTKYGTVTSVMIFEVTQSGYPPEEGVRIFVQFDRPESAMKGLIDLQGRFFGGREVRGAFFPEERFAKVELAPLAGEFDQ